MSFSSQVKEELNSIHIKSNCCKKAYILGAIMFSSVCGDDIKLSISDESTVNELLFLLKAIYKIEPKTNAIKRGCFSAVEISFQSKKLITLINAIDNDAIGDHVEEFSSFIKCSGCRATFMRAVFCASGSVSDPQKSYTLEIRALNRQRADYICSIIDQCSLNTPCRTVRNNCIGLFYRNEASIEDFITACGGNKTLFKFFNVSVEKDLRNTENRATNCVAKNISKSVEAAAIQISAIEALMADGSFDEMPTELKITAKLRIENPDVSLFELSQLHKPSISKSGLNHRLVKIVELAKNLQLI